MVESVSVTAVKKEQVRGHLRLGRHVEAGATRCRSAARRSQVHLQNHCKQSC